MTEVTIKSAPKPKAKSAPAKPKVQPHACECECGGQTVTGKARFIPGHDAKLASKLVTAALGGDKAAERRLAKLGWMSKLDASRRAAQAKSDRAATKANRERAAAEDASRAEPSKPAKPTAA